MYTSSIDTGPCISDNIEVVKAENGILRRKLDTKTEGLMILSKEVEQLKNELNQTKLLNDHLLNPKSSDAISDEATMRIWSQGKGFSTSSARERNRMELYKQLRKKNYSLTIERENLRQQLDDAKTDIRILRENLNKAGRVIRRKSSENDHHDDINSKSVLSKKRESREVLIARMEELQLKHNTLKHDLQRLLDEKEDMIREKEDMKVKIHRMSFQMKQIVVNDKLDLLDLDHIISENKYLSERLERIQAEKDLANNMGRRYKEALEASKKLTPSREHNKEYLNNLLKNFTFPVTQPVDINSPGGLYDLCVSLLETLSDRQIQIKHQRAANKELAHRLGMLQDKMLEVDGGEILMFPSQVIMRDYKPDPSGEVEELPVDLITAKMQTRFQRKSQKSPEEVVPVASSSNVSHEHDQEERPKTPDYDDLNHRFQSLLSAISSRNHSEVVDEDDSVFVEEVPLGSVQLSCSKPPDILDFSRKSYGDIELEDCHITLDGIAVVEEDHEEDLPEHIQQLVNKAMREME